jgi:septum site-determining protein MinC
MSFQGARKSEGLTIKGTAGSLLIRLRDEDAFALLVSELEKRLEEGAKFFRGTKTVIELGKRELEPDELQTLLPLLQRYDISLEHLVSGSQVTRSAAKQLGLAYKLPNSQNTRLQIVSEDATVTPFDNAEALFVRRNLRSGQSLHHHSDIILLGDANAGTEIIAGGNVVVWGALRGVVQAGQTEETSDSPKASVCALQLLPSRLGIGKFVTRAPENLTPRAYPETAFVHKGVIVLEAWQGNKPPKM